MPETPFGRYQLVKRLAMGGMAEIWLAKQAGPGGFEKNLVVKRILPHLAEDKLFIQLFLDEARLAAQLSHPNVAQVTDFGEVEGAYYLAMELVRGPDLRRVIAACVAAKVKFPFAVAARIASQICAALDHAHKAVDSAGKPMNVIHRDVSPQNVLLSLDGNTKLIDFGIAKAKTQSHFTETGTVKGKYAYMAPEQIRGKVLDLRADVYAAGLVLYEMLTGVPGLPGEGQDAIVSALEGNIRPPGELRPDIPAGLLAIIDRATRKDREQRYDDAGQMEAALEEYLVAAGTPVRARDVSAFLQELRIESGDPLTAAGTGSHATSRNARTPAPARAVSAATVGPPLSDARTALRPGTPPRPRAAPVADDDLDYPDAPMAKTEASAPALAAVAEMPPPEQRTKSLPSVDAIPEEDLAAVKKGGVPAGAWVIVGLLGLAGGGVAGYYAIVGRGQGEAPPHRPVVAANPEPLPPKPTLPVAEVKPEPKPEPVVEAKPEPKPEPVAPPAPPVEKKPSPPLHAATVPHPKRPRPPPGLDAAPGSLTVMSVPWSDVTVDGEAFGQTPIVKKALPAGRHKIHLENGEAKLAKDLTLEVGPGEDKKLKVDLSR